MSTNGEVPKKWIIAGNIIAGIFWILGMLWLSSDKVPFSVIVFVTYIAFHSFHNARKLDEQKIVLKEIQENVSRLRDIQEAKLTSKLKKSLDSLVEHLNEKERE